MRARASQGGRLYACVHVELGGNVVHLIFAPNTGNYVNAITGCAGTGTTAGSAQAALDCAR